VGVHNVTTKVIGLVLALVSLSACDSSHNSNDIPPSYASDLRLSPAESVLRVFDAPVQMNLTVLDQYGYSYTGSVAVSWQSDDSNVVSVDQQGAITAHMTGSATISASVDGLQALALVTVDTAAPVLSGSVSYQDVVYNMNGALNPQPVSIQPVRYATINLLDNQGKLMASSNTGSGSYQFDQWLPAQGELQLLASASLSGNSVEVKDVGATLHEYRQAVTSTGVQNILLDAQASADYGAFNVLDALLTAH